MPPPPEPLTDREWRALADALREADPVAREALARLMRHHGVTTAHTQADADSSAGDAGPRGDDPGPSFRFEPGDDADDLNFEAVVPGRHAPHWELTGPFADLTRAAETAGLDANAIRYASEGPEGDGTIIHPSAFCEDPETFLSLLAILARSTPHVRLYRVGRRDTGSVAVLVRVFPNPDPDTMAILDAFDPQGAESVRAAGVAVADALAYLDERATG